MAGITNRQIFDQLQALTARVDKIESNMATKGDIARLERRIVESRQISNKHYFETHKLIGDLNRQFNGMSDRLAKAGDSLHGLA